MRGDIMPNHTYNIKDYETVLKNEVSKLAIILIVLCLLFIAIIIFSVIQIKKDKTKKLPYIQLIASIALFVFLAVFLTIQIVSYVKDISEKTYLQYEGPVNIRIERQVIFGGIPTAYDEYIVSFEHNGEHIELSMRKNYGLIGDIENVYIVYSKHSNYIIEFVK